ncbi:MAG: cysteine desulfurase family protein (TIGR01976 family) [Planctomycetota bacterium]|jgi:cysteine desulfurase family protein (TIGR01976 family)
MWNPDLIRNAFPGMDSEWAFLDNAGGTFPAAQVVGRIQDYLSHHPVQLGASYPLSLEASDLVNSGRLAAARLIKAKPEECIFGASSTTNIALIADAQSSRWGVGDAVVITEADHAANQTPWRRLARQGVEIRVWPIQVESCRLEIEDLIPLLQDGHVRLVAFTHASNVTGTVSDVQSIAAVVRQHGALSFVDGVAYGPHRRVDVGALGVDFYVVSLYKIFGPHLGLMYGRAELLRSLESPNHEFIPSDQLPQKFEPGNPCYELVAGVPGILEHLTDIGEHGKLGDQSDPISAAFEEIALYEEDLIRPLLQFLRDRPEVRVVGEGEPDRSRRVSVVSFVVEGISSKRIVEELERHQLAVRYGHFYAYDFVQRMGYLQQDGVVRVSCAHTNTPAEMDRLLGALEQLFTGDQLSIGDH